MKCYLLATALVLSPLTAIAGSSAPDINQAAISAPAEASSWTVRTTIYGWAQGLDGDIAVYGRTASVNLDFNDIIKDLNFAAMGVIEVNRGRWGFMADLNYAKISTGSIAGPVAIDVENTQFLGDFLVTYQALRTGGLSLDAYAGARVNAIGLTLDVSNISPPVGIFSHSQSKTWMDPVIGGRFQVELTDKLFFRAVGDIGGFGIASDLTWQAMAGFGWRTSQNASLLVGYRGLGTDYSDGGFKYNIVAHGPVLGFDYRF